MSSKSITTKKRWSPKLEDHIPMWMLVFCHFLSCVGIQVIATFRAPAGDDVASIPRSALLKTAEGTFAYTVNGKFYLRTAVKVGAMNEQAVEITDGLYSGDEIVASPVMSLWMAELQVLRGGKACTCGH